jgi:hypothetical protein
MNMNLNNTCFLVHFIDQLTHKKEMCHTLHIPFSLYLISSYMYLFFSYQQSWYKNVLIFLNLLHQYNSFRWSSEVAFVMFYWYINLYWWAKISCRGILSLPDLAWYFHWVLYWMNVYCLTPLYFVINVQGDFSFIEPIHFAINMQYESNVLLHLKCVYTWDICIAFPQSLPTWKDRQTPSSLILLSPKLHRVPKYKL